MKKRYFLITLFLVILSACTSTRDKDCSLEISAEERGWMTEFFSELLFSEKAAYTLWGSKPITEIVLYHYSDEQMNVMFDEANAEGWKDSFYIENYHLPENWERWEKIQNRFPMKRYLLFKSNKKSKSEYSFVYFVNVFATASVVMDHYDLFRQAVGSDFHPLEVVLEIQNENSYFWSQLENSKMGAFLWGLLFGYGKENAMAYHWKYFDSSKVAKTYLETISTAASNAFPAGKVVFSKKHFLLPSFISFSEEDPVREKYEVERQKIKKIYQKGDLLDLTLQKLCN